MEGEAGRGRLRVSVGKKESESSSSEEVAALRLREDAAGAEASDGVAVVIVVAVVRGRLGGRVAVCCWRAARSWRRRARTSAMVCELLEIVGYSRELGMNVEVIRPMTSSRVPKVQKSCWTCWCGGF